MGGRRELPGRGETQETWFRHVGGEASGEGEADGKASLSATRGGEGGVLGGNVAGAGVEALELSQLLETCQVCKKNPRSHMKEP